MLKLVLFLGIFTLTTNGVLSIHDYYMSNRCGSTLSTFFSDQVRLRLTSGYFFANRSCTLTVMMSSNHSMLYFKDIQIPGCTSNTGWLEVYDGSSKFSPSLTSKQKLCGYSPPSGIYRSMGQSLTFYFTSGQVSSYSISAFDIILTPYHTGYCYDNEHDCDNGRCIDDSLTCSGYNPCGDYSDCETTTFATASGRVYSTDNDSSSPIFDRIQPTTSTATNVSTTSTANSAIPAASFVLKASFNEQLFLCIIMITSSSIT